MADDVDAVLGALWTHLGLGRFRPAAEPRARLTVEGRKVLLEATPDAAAILVSVDVGRIASDPVEATDQLRRVARQSCGLVLLRAAALRLTPGEGGAATFQVQAVAPCRVAAVPLLTRAIEDALFLVDVFEPLVRRQPAAPFRSSPASLTPDDLAGAMIFRP